MASRAGGAAIASTATAIISPFPRQCGLPPRQRRRRPHALPRSGLTVRSPRAWVPAPVRARRRVRYEDGDGDGEEEEEEEEEYGHNEEVARLERYSEGARGEALLVKARVDDEVEVVLVFKGFSSSLSGRTAVDPAMSVLPERAIIQSVDVVEGPFDPDNIEYLEKDLPWDDFKTRLH